MSNSKDKVAFNIILPQNPQFFVPVNKKTEFHQQNASLLQYAEEDQWVAQWQRTEKAQKMNFGIT